MARGLLFRAGMNAHFFSTKRAFHGILRVTRKPLASLGLTAARYDMMHELLCGFGTKTILGKMTRQSDLRRQLGVTKSVASRMLTSLETLGWVRRLRPRFGDQRQREIVLTELGLRCIRAARQALARASKRLLLDAICPRTRLDPHEPFHHLCTLEGYLVAMRYCYGDGANLLYPWHPDD